MSLSRYCMHANLAFPDTGRTLRWGPFVLCLARRQLRVNGLPVKLGARAFDVLAMLVSQRHRQLSRGELIERVWPGVVVQHNNLEVQISALRRLLGAESIATIPGRGYRFAMLVDDDVPAERSGAVHGAMPTFLSPPQTGLATRLSPLIGRADDLAALGVAIRQSPLVTVVGLGGIGKTLLVQHLSKLERHQRAHGVCWVDLAALHEGGDVAATIADALGIADARGDRLQTLAACAAPLDMLLALDNADLLAGAVATVVRRLLESAPALRIVVTSQVPLRLAQERLFRLAPLAVPAGDLPAEVALRFGSVALFVERVRAVQQGFALTQANVAAVCGLCRRLDGHALAIELAATRVPLLGLQGLELALEHRLEVLVKGRRDAPPRHQSLRASLEGSHALLNADEQAVFRRLGTVDAEPGFDLALAEQLVAQDGLCRWRLLAALDTLVDHSLVELMGPAADDDRPHDSPHDSPHERPHGSPHDSPRYRLRESPLALARERLAAGSETAAAIQGHAEASGPG